MAVPKKSEGVYLKKKKDRIILGIVCFLLFSIYTTAGFASDKKVEVLLFYSPHCKACLSLKKDFLPKILDKYGKEINLKELNVLNPENLALLLSFASRFKEKTGYVPAMVVGDTFLVGTTEIENNLEEAIKEAILEQRKIKVSFTQRVLIDKFKEISLATLIFAGLSDGVNPCAFAVIVFFLSFLAVYGYKREEMFWVGVFYILAVFITYLLISLGLFNFIYALSNFYIVIKAFYYLVSGFCFLLFFLALYDFVRYRKTKETDGLILQLPKFFKKRINIVIGRGLREKKQSFFSLAIISFVVGFLVSLLEAVCTGQVLVPTIVSILRVPELRKHALLYLVIYNIMFILPLILIFILSFLGVSSQQFNKFLRRHLGMIKLAMAILFLALGILILVADKIQFWVKTIQ